MHCQPRLYGVYHIESMAISPRLDGVPHIDFIYACNVQFEIAC